MKGAELNVILAIIFVVLILAILFVAGIIPIFNAAASTGKDTDFWSSCAEWSKNGFHSFQNSNDADTMNALCTRALGKDCITPCVSDTRKICCLSSTNDWDECRRACSLSTDSEG